MTSTDDETVIHLEKFTIFPPSRNAPIVYEFNLSVTKGSLVALMGGSGCGKTTLMVYLTRRMRNPYTDWGVTATKYKHPNRVEFVAQKEMFFPYDTPERHLLFLRQKRFVESFEASQEAVTRTLKLVGLVDEHKRHSQIGDAGRESTLSGGERRLLTIAAALITEPEIIILDEPTTGMDGYTALTIVQQLSRISKEAGTTFVVSIHQPSEKLLAEFTNVVRMVPPAGTFVRAPPLLEIEDENEFESNALPKVSVDASPDGGGANVVTLNHAGFAGKTLHLLRLYLWKAIMRCVTNWRAGPLRLVASLVFAIMCGVAWVNLDFSDGNYIRDILGMALAIIGLSFAPIILNATLFATERDLLLEEHVALDDHTLVCDMTARFLVDLLLGAAAALVLMVCIPIIGIKYVGYFYLTMWMQAWAADSFGFWISMIAPPHISIGIIIPTVGFLSVALGTGLMQPKIENEGYIFHVCKWGSFFKYGFQALLLKEMPRVTVPCTRNCFVPDGAAMLDMMHLTGDGYETTMGFQYLMLFAFTLVLRVIAYLTLRFLIQAGNRRYSYDNSSAGAPAAPSETPSQTPEATPQVTPRARSHEPYSSEAEPKEDLTPEAPLVHPPSEARRYWKMGAVRVAPSIVDKVGNKMSGIQVPEEHANRVVLDVPEFSIHPRETVAIIGPTGAGKTLLLRNLGSRLGEGCVATEKTRFYSNCAVCREPTIQFVDGNDEILPNLQAIEPVMFHSSLYDANASEEEVRESSAEQLLALGIHAEKHNNMAYTLSGGQLRRLSVACKTVMHPAVLLIDEPTSGLDHDAALNLAKHLQSMARHSGVAIICSLQQPDPELLKYFDSFVFMRNGRVVVRGNELECRRYLGLCETCVDLNWAEEALYALSKTCETCEGAERRVPDQCAQQEPEAVESERVEIFHDPRRSMLFCIKELTKRTTLNRWGRAPRQTLIAFLIRYLLLPVILSILLVNVGSKDPLYFSRSGLIFVYCACMTFSSTLNGAVNFPIQRKMIEEEINANLYTTTSYLLSQWYTVALVEDIVGSVLASIAIKYIATLQANLGIIIIASFVTSQCADAIGYLCGLFRNLSVASGLTVLVLMPFMIGGNVIATTEQVTRIPLLYVLEVLSTVRYSYLIIFRSELDESQPTAVADMIFDQYGLNYQPKWFEVKTLWPVFVCYMVLLRFIALIVYRRLVCPKCNA